MLNPPYHPKYSRSQRSPAVIKSGVMYYPIWLAYATGVLEQAGFTVKLVDAPADNRDLNYVVDLAQAFQPRLIVMDTSTPSVYNDIEIAEVLKVQLPGVFIVLVGPHIPAFWESEQGSDSAPCPCPAIDAVAMGEYDYTLCDLARLLQAGSLSRSRQELGEVLGLSYRDNTGVFIHNSPRPLIKALDALPFVSAVYKRHLRIENYFYSITRYPEVAIVTGRGCPHQCVYCIWPQTLTGRGYRKRSVANVADEFEFIARELPQVKEIFVEDDTLTVDSKRSIELAHELVKRGNRLPFTANSRADVSYETLHALKQAGLRLVCVGFESGDQAVLDAIKKRVTVDQFYQFRQAARQAGVLVHGCFMAGNPGETRASLQKTLELARRLDPDTAQFFPIMVYPGTAAYDWARQNGYLTTTNFRDWLTPDGLHKSIVNYPGLSAEDLVAWCDEARRSFYLRPRYIGGKLRQMLADPAEAVRIIKAALSFLAYLVRPSLRAKSRYSNSPTDGFH
jgi:radical SAM superfamily enzyme YgiQ (UPF0313 family)